VKDNWTVQDNQSVKNTTTYPNVAEGSALRASDLQIAKYSSGFAMEHRMGLIAGTIPDETEAADVITYDGNTYNSSATGEKWTRIESKCTAVPWNASTTFTSSTNTPYNSGNILYYIAKPADATIAISATEGTSLYAWSVSGDDTTVSDANDYKTFTITVPDYANTYNKKVWEFSFTGTSPSSFVVPFTGGYTFECWGANGGESTANSYSNKGGVGGYTMGTISLTKDENYIIYVGGQGTKTTGGSGGGYNGGANGANSYDNNYRSGGGGGATDIRITSGDLRTRIMVAAGGGGSCQSNGGDGGGLIGLSGNHSQGSDGGGGKQNAATSNSSQGFGSSTSYFGVGGTGASIAGSGGGGWWGGAGGVRAPYHDGSGGGGSSFISGHPGCNAVNSSGTHLGASTTMTIGGKEYVFSGTVMIDGSGKEWTTASQTTGGSSVGLPSKPETTDNGYARITYTP